MTASRKAGDGETLYITVKTDEQFLDDARSAVEALANDESVERPNELSFESVNALFREFTPKKIELLGTVAGTRPESITEAAEIVDRDLKNVHQNLVELAELNVIEFVENDRAKRPVARYDGLRIEVPFVDRPAERTTTARAD